MNKMATFHGILTRIVEGAFTDIGSIDPIDPV